MDDSRFRATVIWASIGVCWAVGLLIAGYTIPFYTLDGWSTVLLCFAFGGLIGITWYYYRVKDK